MAYIYKITNDINNKVYIGKTHFSIEKRMREHKHDAHKPGYENRPLYKAMRAYGTQHFHIELLEETNQPEAREIFWIDCYDSYHNGYNATYGGDGAPRLDYNQIINTYLDGHSVKETAEICNVDVSYTSIILKQHGINVKSSDEILKAKCSKRVQMMTLDTHIVLQTFDSTHDAARYLINQHMSKATVDSTASAISQVCQGKQRSSRGFYWQYI